MVENKQELKKGSRRGGVLVTFPRRRLKLSALIVHLHVLCEEMTYITQGENLENSSKL